MVQTERQPIGTDEDLHGARELYLILYPKELEDEVIQTLESTGVPGYTEMPKMIGRGRHIRHFDNAVWPVDRLRVHRRDPRTSAHGVAADVRGARGESRDAESRAVRHPHLCAALRAGDLARGLFRWRRGSVILHSDCV